MRIFYLIWVDVIVSAKSRPGNQRDWKGMTLAFMTAVMAVDFLFVMVIMQELLGCYFYVLKIPTIPKAIGNWISFILLFVVPPLLINYVLVFKNDRYEKLLMRYNHRNGKLATTYILLGLMIPTVVLFLAFFLGKF